MLKKMLLMAAVLLLAAVPVFSKGVQEDGHADELMPYKGESLTVSMWGYNMDLLEKNVIKPFEEKHGVDIIVETGNNSDRFTKMMARKDNPLVDVALFAGAWAYKAMEEEIIKPYDPEKLENLSAVMEAARDPLGGQYAIGYTIQHLGLVYRTDKLDPITSWKDLSKKDVREVLSIPGITTTYGPSIIYMLSKAWGGDFKDFEAGWEKLEEMAPYLVTVYSRSSELNTLISQEEVYAAPYASFSWGSIKASGLPLETVIPEEGLVGSFSMVSVGAGTEKDDLAHMYVDHLLSYDVQLAEAMDLVDSPARTDISLPEEIAENLTYGDELISQLHFFSQKEMAETQEEWIDRWNRIFSE
ncbi:MAG: ABC transporter substrate-binding protein [Spirochaetia bacterium]|nr:ABC transporter substrate-binding protein [Spirochaetia bacterium]MCF7953331.1 ABC transporter substrate-binding protein [Spirochaetales bacterium]